MLTICMQGMNAPDHANMVDNVWAMPDLSDYEESPRHGIVESMVNRECTMACRAYDIAVDMVRQLDSQSVDSDGEPIESTQARYNRYQHSNLDEVSEPAYWHEVNYTDGHEHQTEDSILLTDGEAELKPEEHGMDDSETFEEKKDRYLGEA